MKIEDFRAIPVKHQKKLSTIRYLLQYANGSYRSLLIVDPAATSSWY